MLDNLWKYIAGLLSLIVVTLGAALLYTGGQRDRAKEAATVAKARAKSQEDARAAEKNIDEARAEARQKAVEVEREQIDARQSGRRPVVFGDKRLRMHDNRDGDDQA